MGGLMKTSRWKRAGIAAVALTLLASTAAIAAPAAATHHESGSIDTATLQQELDAMVGQGAASATAEVRDGGRRVWRGTSGVAQLGATMSVPANARFRIGSVTK